MKGVLALRSGLREKGRERESKAKRLLAFRDNNIAQLHSGSRQRKEEGPVVAVERFGQM